MSVLIPCQFCRTQYPNSAAIWVTCNKCGYRICIHCISKHKSNYGAGYKCSQCAFGQMKGPLKAD